MRVLLLKLLLKKNIKSILKFGRGVYKPPLLGLARRKRLEGMRNVPKEIVDFVATRLNNYARQAAPLLQIEK